MKGALHVRKKTFAGQTALSDEGRKSGPAEREKRIASWSDSLIYSNGLTSREFHWAPGKSTGGEGNPKKYDGEPPRICASTGNHRGASGFWTERGEELGREGVEESGGHGKKPNLFLRRFTVSNPGPQKEAWSDRKKVRKERKKEKKNRGSEC